MYEREIYEILGNHYALYMKIVESTLHAIGLSNLSFSHGCVLEHLIRTQKRMTLSELAVAINRDKSTCTQLVKKLEQLDLVTRTRNKLDHRSFFIEASENALGLRDQFDQLSNSIATGVKLALSEREQTLILDFLDRMDYQLSKRF